VHKTELVAAIAAETTYPKTTVHDIVSSTLEIIQGELVDEGEVVLPGFAKFSTKVRSARQGHNPATGKKMDMPAKTIVSFKAGAALKRAVAGE